MTIFSFRKMETEILCEDLYLGFSMDRFVNKKLNILDNITLMEIINDVIHRRTFIKYVQKTHPSETEPESLRLLKRYILCQKILMNHEDFDDKENFEHLIESCSTFLWEQKLKSLENNGEKDINFIIELICHNDYRFFLTAVKKRSSSIKIILKEIYRLYYF